MSITDELRKWGYGFCGDTNDVVTAIADRIDAEHEAMLVDARKTVYQGYIELPKDADGEYIHIGDRMEWVRYKDDDPTVVRTVSGIGNGVFFAWSDEQGRYAQYEAHAYRHYHAPTVEDVLREFANEVYADADNEIRDRDFLCAKYAKRLTLAEGED